MALDWGAAGPPAILNAHTMSDAIQSQILEALAVAVKALCEASELALNDVDEMVRLVALERPKDPQNGDYSCNLAMRLAKPAKKPPRALAEQIVAQLEAPDAVREVVIAGPGFINFYLRQDAQQGVVRAVLKAGDSYGNGVQPHAQNVHIEFCSANPTGPLHVGHGRGAAYGMALANVMEAAGARVHREYYVNDAGRQIDILATSTWLRALEATGVALRFPTKAYQGEYIIEMAGGFPDLKAAVPQGFPEGFDDPEEELNAFIVLARNTLGKQQWPALTAYVVECIRKGIERDLDAFAVCYEEWFSERALFANGEVQAVIDKLSAAGYIYEEGGALWFRSTGFGDEKDRVVIRDNGIPTYFASDIAYHFNKFSRGYDHVIDVWGADHHGYIARVHGALSALGIDTDRIEILLVQFATLVRNGEKVQMSTRSGQFVELAELVDEVGPDAARYFYVTRRSEQHLEFDLEIAKAESKDNPVYYIQYAHARISAVLRAVAEQGILFEPATAEVSLLTDPREVALSKTLQRFPEVIQSAAQKREPHQVANYLKELANGFHSYYNDTRVLVDDMSIRSARLALLCAVKIVVARGLKLLGVRAPERM